MKRRIQTIVNTLLLAVVAGLMCSSTAASAQTGARVTIPFAFVVNDHYVPAGAYTVYLMSDNILTLIDVHTGTCLGMFQVHTADADHQLTRSSLVFHVSGTRHILSEVRFANTNMQSELTAQPKTDQELASNSGSRSVEIGMR